MDSVEDYARQWTKREKLDLYTLSEWAKSVRSLMQIGIKNNSDKYVIISADKVLNYYHIF